VHGWWWLQVYPTKCPVGTFSPSVGNTNQSACLACTAGFYCPEQAMESTTGRECAAGYFCPTGVCVCVLRRQMRQGVLKPWMIVQAAGQVFVCMCI
jgi:hypothetical protein